MVTVGSVDRSVGWGLDVDVVGSVACVAAAGTGGLRVIDVSDAAAAVELGFLDTPGYVVQVEVVGSIAYVADSGLGVLRTESGLRILDVSTPATPVVLGVLETPGAVDVDVVGALDLTPSIRPTTERPP
jgi:hypothetical protein